MSKKRCTMCGELFPREEIRAHWDDHVSRGDEAPYQPMTVEEMMQRLSTFPPTAYVTIRDHESACLGPVVTVVTARVREDEESPHLILGTPVVEINGEGDS